jgi:hypothetical protein
MGFIVLPSISRSLELSVYESTMSASVVAHEDIPSPASEISPVPIKSLFLDQVHEVERIVVLVRLGSRIAEESLLVQLFRDLDVSLGIALRRQAHVQDALRSHMKQPRARLLQFNSGQG